MKAGDRQKSDRRQRKSTHANARNARDLKSCILILSRTQSTCWTQVIQHSSHSKKYHVKLTSSPCSFPCPIPRNGHGFCLMCVLPDHFPYTQNIILRYLRMMLFKFFTNSLPHPIPWTSYHVGNTHRLLINSHYHFP